MGCYAGYDGVKSGDKAVMLKEVQYKKGNNLFIHDIMQLCGDRSHYALNVSCDSDMKNAAALRNQLVYNVFPIINKYEEDKKIFDDFESYDTPWRYDYFSTEYAFRAAAVREDTRIFSDTKALCAAGRAGDKGRPSPGKGTV